MKSIVKKFNSTLVMVLVVYFVAIAQSSVSLINNTADSSFIMITINRTSGYYGDLSVDYFLQDGSDYILAEGTVYIPIILHLEGQWV